MNISPDGFTVRFKTEPEDLFYSEKSGAKPNTVRIIDHYERQQLKKKLPHKIIIQHGQEIFLRTITHVYVSEMILGKYLAIFSWTNEKHHHPGLNENDPNALAHTMSIDEVEPAIDLIQTAILIPRRLVADLNTYRDKATIPEFISKLLDNYEQPPTPTHYPHPQNRTTTDDTALIAISEGMKDTLKNIAQGRSMDKIIRDLYQIHLNKHAEEVGPLHD